MNLQSFSGGTQPKLKFGLDLGGNGNCVDLLIETVHLVSGLGEAQRVKCEAKWSVKNEFISVGGL